MRNTTARFFIGVVVGFAAAGMLIRIPRPITPPTNVNTAKARRTETAFEQVASLASATCGASASAAPLERKVGQEPSSELTATVAERATLNVDRSSSDRSATEQAHLVLRC
jgi:hypothetical protein